MLIERDHVERASTALGRVERLASSLSFDAWVSCEVYERAWRIAVSGAPRRAYALVTTHLSTANPPPLFEARFRALGARLLVELGDLEAAVHFLGAAPLEGFCDLSAVAMQIALARDDRDAAREIVANWPPHHALQEELVFHLWAAALAHVEGEERAAAQHAEYLTAAASAEGYARLFLDGGAQTRWLLAMMARRQPRSYLASLLRRDGSEGNHVHSPPGRPALTERERAVLRDLAGRLTYSEISERLFISPNTVKTHAKSVYMKLGVRGRLEAVERAEDLGLL